MPVIRCSKCGSDAGFLVETADRKVLDVKGKLAMDRIMKSVLLTCTYCNNRWDFVPVILRDNSIDEKVRAQQEPTLVQ
jgi:hypothetical protein